MPSDVHHLPESRRFVVEIEGHQAYLEYHMLEHYLVISHTVVPEPIGGRGIAADLVHAAYEFAREKDYKVRPACSYAAAWSQRHPEYAELVG